MTISTILALLESKELGKVATQNPVFNTNDEPASGIEIGTGVNLYHGFFESGHSIWLIGLTAT